MYGVIVKPESTGKTAKSRTLSGLFSIHHREVKIMTSSAMRKKKWYPVVRSDGANLIPTYTPKTVNPIARANRPYTWDYVLLLSPMGTADDRANCAIGSDCSLRG